MENPRRRRLGAMARRNGRDVDHAEMSICSASTEDLVGEKL